MSTAWHTIQLVLPTILIGFGIAALLIVALDWKLLLDDKRRGSVLTALVMIFCLAVIGATAGFSGGSSRVGVVGDIYPAILTLMGAGAVYLLGVDFSKGAMVSVSALTLATTLFMGYDSASTGRSVSDEVIALRQVCTSALTSEALANNPAAFDRFIRYLSVDVTYAKSGAAVTDSVDLCKAYANQWNLADPMLGQKPL